MSIWVLPKNIADVLPNEARQLEHVRHYLINYFQRCGYELIIPPMIEFVESLLAGSHSDLDLDTFKVVDQLSGRLMGVRADITPQVSRIDAHLHDKKSISRLCYAGSVLHTRPKGQHVTREPYQFGAEIFGYDGLEADQEIQRLVQNSLQALGIKHFQLNLSHAGLINAIFEVSGLTSNEEAAMRNALAIKDLSQLSQLCQPSQLAKPLDPSLTHAICCLPELFGNADMIDHVYKILPPIPKIQSALNELSLLVEFIRSQYGSAEHTTIDLADLAGYPYHTGVTFSVYVKGIAGALARGGRFDKLSQAFGCTRPATGFSIDLRELIKILPEMPRQSAIIAPSVYACRETQNANSNNVMTDKNVLDDKQNLEHLNAVQSQEYFKKRQEKIESLRLAGEIVIELLPKQNMNHESWYQSYRCDRQLKFENGNWQVVNLNEAL